MDKTYEKSDLIVLDKTNTPTIYYAHHRWKYGTQIEAYELDLIRKYYPLATIFNPSEHLDVEGRSEEDIMKDCLAAVKDADVVIFSSMDGVIGKGVHDELVYAVNNKKPILYIFHDHLIGLDTIRICVHNDPSNGDRTYALVQFDESKATMYRRPEQ